MCHLRLEYYSLTNRPELYSNFYFGFPRDTLHEDGMTPLSEKDFIVSLTNSPYLLKPPPPTPVQNLWYFFHPPF